MRRGDTGEGSVTAETALALPAVVLVALVVAAVGQVAVAQIRCVDAARAAVRLAARGEADPAVLARASSLAPDGASVTAGTAGDEAVVDVSGAVELPLGLRLSVGARAVADVEPGVDGQRP